MPVLTVPAALRRQLGEEATDGLVELINSADASSREDVLEFVGERFERRLSEDTGKLDARITTEVAKLGERITQVEARLNERIAETEARLRVEISKLDARITESESRLRVEIHQNRSDLIRWMFAFWVGQIAVTATLIALFK
ncbi:MAG: DUF1640 domain-containing protein [Chloroflexi bacterium]|nr:DUF1640 domain-containing protein [Chloroflexota bacterium]MBI3761849.1 DUF1640 domain-containing protein [Chloroflexota bacterium]